MSSWTKKFIYCKIQCYLDIDLTVSDFTNSIHFLYAFCVFVLLHRQNYICLILFCNVVLLFCFATYYVILICYVILFCYVDLYPSNLKEWKPLEIIVDVFDCLHNSIGEEMCKDRPKNNLAKNGIFFYDHFYFVPSRKKG